MNRRKLLAMLGASPVAAALPAVAEAKPFEVPDNRAKVEPMIGELRYAAEQMPAYDPVHTHTFGMPSHTHSGMIYASASSYYAGYAVGVLKIWDGGRWVNENSPEGVAVKNMLLRS